MKKDIIIVLLCFIIFILGGLLFNIFGSISINEKIINTRNNYIDEFPRHYDFSNKRVFIEGDSIQSGFGKYLEKTSFLLDTKFPVNNSVSGATIAYNGNKNNLYHRIVENKELDFDNYDVIFISAGINDYDKSVPLGNYDSYKKNETSGALNLIIDRIHYDNRFAKIVFFTPMYRFKNNKNYEFKKNNVGIDLKSYRDTLKKVGTQQKYKGFLYVIEGDKLTNSDEYLNMSFDGLHPTEELASIISKRATVKLRKIVY